MFSDFTIAELRKMRKDAVLRYTKLVSGASARVFVDQSGERVEYTQASASKLMQWADMIQREIERREGSGGCGPLYAVF